MTTKTIYPAIVLATLGLLWAAPSRALAKDHVLLNHTGWRACIDRPGRGLLITARLTLPTPGYKVSLKMAYLLKSNPPVPVYKLVLKPPTKFVAQVVTTINFKHNVALPGLGIQTVIITYKEKQVAQFRVAEPSNGAKKAC